MSAATTGKARSVHTRLIAHAKRMGHDPNLVLTRYVAERFLYRLSCSPHVERFVLKGGLLLLVWLGEQTRPTRDADLLGIGDLSEAEISRIFREVCAQAVPDDGLVFGEESIRVSRIRLEDPYGGRRAVILARLGAAKLRLQVDVGIGDSVSPPPEWLEFPSLLDLPRPRLRAYRPETAIAEKFHAMVTLGSNNSRMRDFYDIDALARTWTFASPVLAKAIAATFQRRGTRIPATLPLALTPEFASTEKAVQWHAFLGKAALGGTEALPDVIARLAVFLAPALEAARGRKAPAEWPAGGPWAPGTAEEPT